MVHAVFFVKEPNELDGHFIRCQPPFDLFPIDGQVALHGRVFRPGLLKGPVKRVYPTL